MDQIEAILTSDDQNLGSFGSLEKGIGYTALLCMTLPVLLIPLIFATLGKSIYKTTAFLLAIFLLFFLTFRFRFSWIVWLHNHLQKLHNARI